MMYLITTIAALHVIGETEMQKSVKNLEYELRTQKNSLKSADSTLP